MQSAKTILQIYRSNDTEFLYKKHSKKKKTREICSFDKHLSELTNSQTISFILFMLYKNSLV